MNKDPSPLRLVDSPDGTASADLETVLHAWHDATNRWEQVQQALTDDVRRLTGALQARDSELLDQRRLAEVGRVAEHVTRGIREHLVVASLHLGLLRRRLLDDALALELLQKVEHDLADADSSAHDLSHFSADYRPEPRLVSVRALVEEVHAALLPRLSAQGVATVLDVAEKVTVLADQEMLRRAIYHLTLNALLSMPAGGEIVVTSYSGPRGVELEFADSGAGMTDDARRRPFEPRLQAEESNSGLALAIVRRIVEAHGGKVTALNCPEGGTAFTLCFPRQALEAAA